jgi:hypothetical protein
MQVSRCAVLGYGAPDSGKIPDRPEELPPLEKLVDEPR